MTDKIKDSIMKNIGRRFPGVHFTSIRNEGLMFLSTNPDINFESHIDLIRDFIRNYYDKNFNVGLNFRWV